MAAYMKLVLEDTHIPGKWFTLLKNRILHQNGNAYIFGMGNDCRTFMKYMSQYGFTAKAFTDNSSIVRETALEHVRKAEMTGFTDQKHPLIISPQELFERYDGELVIVASTGYAFEIKSQLMERNIPEDKILLFEPFRNPYFDVFPSREGEIFVDAGCYDGKTTVAFTKWCPSYAQIFAFELNPQFARQCLHQFSQYDIENVEFINKGTWKENAVLSFSDGGQGSALTLGGKNTAHVTAIDQVLCGRKVTYIKMDVEGSELESLQGAESTIRAYKPKLAVCIYHKPNDIFTIPEYLLSLVPEYRFYLRHYSFDQRETVLYAIL
jgi:FkbM family methyltransferase